MTPAQLVPSSFPVPDPPDHALFRFQPLGPQHNAADLDAWTTSIEHIHATPGFFSDGWPDRVGTLADNARDLETHRAHHAARLDFAWAVLDVDVPGRVIGSVYLKPDRTLSAAAEARSWVRADCAELVQLLRQHLRTWFSSAWPISIRYA